ncbi:MAG: xanthine dehydrogenase family protein molybdopterin-binding subunit [Alphaproteobacteria bacterium]|nr:xanthine dehydrogenase family protein molybdopterin-binding subunit [Alphaproteobacteria bacterium]
MPVASPTPALPHKGGGREKRGVGASLRRKEDDRYLRGRGQFVADIALPGMLEVAFLRSPIAHGRIRAIGKPRGAEHLVFTAADLVGVQPIRSVSALKGFKASAQPILAEGKVRQAGELIAACLGATRAEAEDLAEQVELDLADLPAVHDMEQAKAPGAPLVHEEWGDNIVLDSLWDGDLATAKAQAPIQVTRRIRTARQHMAPLENRGVVCHWDRRLDQLVMYSATQMPHINRNGLSDCLGIDQGRIRVVAPDVGGGFGYKGILLPEEVCLAWLAIRLDRPVRWLEDRREALVAGANCREHLYDITLYAERDGRLLGIDCEAIVDSGAYSSYPFSACLEAAQVSSILPGPYKMERYRCRTYSVATNKAPILPYRGVARSGVCLALELMIDLVAREAGLEPHEVRLKNLVQPEEMPFDNITKKHFDSGDYPESVRRAVDAIGLPGLRRRQSQGESDGRRLGVGMAIYCEQAAHGTSVYAGWGIPMVPGHEPCVARLSPDGILELRIGAHSHGQGLETTMAQVAHEVLGIDPDNVRLIHGDTATTPYSTGTWGSRCAVMSGGAVATACREIGRRVRNLAATLMEVPADTLVLADGLVEAPGTNRKMTLGEVAHVWYRKPQLVPAGVDPGGLETTVGYKAKRDTGTFSYSCHAVAVLVDTETGGVEIVDYVVVEDGGKLINPMIVDGQILGGTAQGIGTALYEEMPFDASGQPLASTFADYLLPSATEVPAVRIDHMETPSPYTEFGQKGIGEGGAIAPPGAIANAVNDALRFLGAEVMQAPITPRRVLAAIEAARSAD